MKQRKDIGIVAEAPKEPCTNDACPWHGHLKIRGRLFKGAVVSSKPRQTCIVEWSYAKYVSKFERYERRNTRIAAHNPKCIAAQVGDVVRIGECKPLSKSKRFVIFEKMAVNA